MNKKLELLEKYAGLVTVRNHLMFLLETSRGLFVRGDQSKITNLVREIDKEIIKVALSNDAEEIATVIVKTPQPTITTENVPTNASINEAFEEKPKKSAFRRINQE